MADFQYCFLDFKLIGWTIINGPALLLAAWLWGEGPALAGGAGGQTRRMGIHKVVQTPTEGEGPLQGCLQPCRGRGGKSNKNERPTRAAWPDDEGPARGVAAGQNRNRSTQGNANRRY